MPPSGAQPAEPTSAAVDERYHEAFTLLAQGQRAAAAARLRELVAAAPAHPLAARAQALLELLAPAGAPRASELPGDGDAARSSAALDDEPRTAAARAELTVFQTLHGALLGAEVCVLADCEEAQPWVLSLMLGAGAGFGTSFALSDGGVRPGLSRALSDGTIFGALNGAWAMLMVEKGDASEKTVAGYLAIGQLTGLVLGGILSDQLRPTTGQVSLAASGGIWAPLAAAELAGALGGDFEERSWGTLMLVTMNGGLAAGAYLASEVPTSASRALLIDGGGVLGTLAGLGLGVLVQGDQTDTQVTLGAGFLGTIGGLALAYGLTQAWDGPGTADMAALHFSAAPRAEGGFSASLGGSW